MRQMRLSDSDSDTSYQPVRTRTFEGISTTTVNPVSLALASHRGGDSGTTVTAGATFSFGGSSTVPGIEILDLRKLMDSKRGVSKTSSTAPATVIRPSQVPSHARWESDEEEIEVNSSGNERNQSESRRADRNYDQDADTVNMHSDEDSSSSDTRFHSRESEHNDGGRHGSFFIPNPLTGEHWANNFYT